MKKGYIEGITGGMFSGKSSELIRIIKEARSEGNNVIVFNYSKDTRYGINSISSHDMQTIEAIPTDTIEEIFAQIAIKENNNERVDMVCIDEAQFFGEKLILACETLAEIGKNVVISGLDQDFRGEPFAPMDILMAKADKVKKLNAKCSVCGGIASRSQRLIKGKPAHYNDNIIQIGAKEMYESRCRNCHIVPKD
ncbi:thymidine kinase [Helicobacter pylori]